MTNFGSFSEKSWQWHNIGRKKFKNLLVLLVPQSFYLYHFFQKYELSEHFAKSKSIILKSYFNIFIFNFSRFKMNFGILFENFSADRWYQLSHKNQRHLLLKLKSILNFLKLRKKIENLAKTHLLVFALFVDNFSNKHHYNLLIFLKIFCFWCFCPKWLFSKLLVLNFDLCIKFVALIKIVTVYMYFICVESTKLVQAKRSSSETYRQNMLNACMHAAK